MAYIKQTWSNGDVITKSKLDHIEDGIYDNAATQSSESGGVISVKNAGGTTLFTITLPVYNGGVS